MSRTSIECIVQQFIRLFLVHQALDTIWGTVRLLPDAQMGGGMYPAVMAYVRLTRPLLILSLLYFIFRLRKTDWPYVYIFVFGLPVLLAAIMGLCIQNEFYPAVADLSNVLVGFLSLWLGLIVFSNVELRRIPELFIKNIWIWFFPCFLSFLVFITLYLTGKIAYPGFSPGEVHIYALMAPLLGPIGIFFFIACVFVLLFSGMRGLLVSLIVTGTFSLAFRTLRYGTVRGFFFLTAFVLSGFVFLVFLLGNVSFDDVYASNITSVQKFSRFDPRPYDLQTKAGLSEYLNLATSGRWLEIEGVIAEFQKEPLFLFAGKGLGATFTLEFGGDGTNDEALSVFPYGKHRNAHFSYITGFLIFGFGFLFHLALILLSLVGLARYLFFVWNSSVLVPFQIIVAQLIKALIGFTLYQDTLLWFFTALGLVLWHQRQFSVADKPNLFGKQKTGIV